jgi:hypothetical protein
MSVLEMLYVLLLLLGELGKLCDGGYEGRGEGVDVRENIGFEGRKVIFQLLSNQTTEHQYNRGGLQINQMSG